MEGHIRDNKQITPSTLLQEIQLPPSSSTGPVAAAAPMCAEEPGIEGLRHSFVLDISGLNWCDIARSLHYLDVGDQGEMLSKDSFVLGDKFVPTVHPPLYGQGAASLRRRNYHPPRIQASVSILPSQIQEPRTKALGKSHYLMCGLPFSLV